MKIIKLLIDGIEIEAKEGENLLQASLDSGIYIPHLCYHPDLSPQGGCKLCSVEIEGRPSLVQSCETLVEDGMVVNTKSEKVKKLRNLSLELLLTCHPKDCTSCDKYLNCELQALMQYTGVVHSRLREIDKENARIAQSDSLIQKEMNRCIQCGRCIRACEELRGVKALLYNKKNGETYVNTRGDKALNETDCRFCGACVEVCPTGAIQDIKGIFSKESPRQMALIPCKDKCPAHTDIPEYIRLTGEGNYGEAVCVLREKLTFPHSLGYICTHVCELGCKRNYVNSALSIREIKRFAVENDREELWKSKIKRVASNGKKVAVVGGGPSGMTSAYALARKGYDVTVFEKQTYAGGMLSFGIPKYRMPQEIVDHEIETLLEAGIKLKTNTKINALADIDKSEFDAVLLAMGAQKGKRPNPYNQSFSNAYDAVEICRMASEGTLPNLGERVTVYGGGNVAFDSARIAKKCGASSVSVICLEARDQMLADAEEVDCALDEAIEILNSKSLVEINSKKTEIESLHLIDVLSFKFGDKGLELEVKPHSDSVLITDTLIFATGQRPDLNDSFGVALFRGSFINTDDQMLTSEGGVFATGDVIYGTKSVIEAIASGRQAAVNIDKYLGGNGDISEAFHEKNKLNPRIGVVEQFSELNRIECLQNGLQAKQEAVRCLQCDLRLDIQKVKYWVDPHYKKVKAVTK